MPNEDAKVPASSQTNHNDDTASLYDLPPEIFSLVASYLNLQVFPLRRVSKAGAIVVRNWITKNIHQINDSATLYKLMRFAINLGDIELIKPKIPWLLEQQKLNQERNSNLMSDFDHLIYQARNNLGVLKFLIRNGIIEVDAFKLCFAIKGYHLDFVNFLLEYRIDINFSIEKGYNQNYRPILVAVCESYRSLKDLHVEERSRKLEIMGEIICVLIKHGFNVNLESYLHSDFSYSLIKHIVEFADAKTLEAVLPFVTDELFLKRSLLYVNDDREKVKLLLKYGADVTQEYKDGATLLFSIISWENNYDFFKEVVKKVNVNKRNYKGETCLYFAAIQGRFKHIVFLLQNGANPFLVSKKLTDSDHKVDDKILELFRKLEFKATLLFIDSFIKHLDELPAKNATLFFLTADHYEYKEKLKERLKQWKIKFTGKEKYEPEIILRNELQNYVTYLSQKKSIRYLSALEEFLGLGKFIEKRISKTGFSLVLGSYVQSAFSEKEFESCLSAEPNQPSLINSN